MQLIRDFCQNDLLPEDSLGICTRITFKWLALEIGKGEFRYEKFNEEKSSAKMAKYGDPFIQKLCDKNFSSDCKQQAGHYVLDDVISMENFVNLWGKRVVDANKKEIKGIRATYVAAPTSLSTFVQDKVKDWSSLHAMHSFYTKKPAQGLQNFLGEKGKMLSTGFARVENPDRNIMSGHVVGISGSSNTFFDCNFGLYRFDGKDPVDIVKEIELHIENEYHPEKTFRLGIVLLGQ